MSLSGTNKQQQLKIELLSQWKLEAEFRNSNLLRNDLDDENRQNGDDDKVIWKEEGGKEAAGPPVHILWL